jgi:Mycotoxin biosynthesis protein UstYa
MMIRDFYWAAMRGERNLKKIEAEGKELLTYVYHENHCFDYIRQAILCAGDMSIEGVAVPETKDETPHINGYGGRHECKSYVSSS